MSVYIDIIFIFLVGLDALSDGLRDEYKKYSHLLDVLLVVVLLLLPYLYPVCEYNIFNYIISYIFIRFVLFDYIYNLVRGLPYHYLGSTSYYGIIFRKIPPVVLLFFKILILLVVIFLI